MEIKMPHLITQDFKNTALKAAESAKSITLHYFRHLTIVEAKNCSQGWDPVTLADKQAEEKIRHIIETDFPNHNIIGEEYANKITESDYTWIIDPIDGTRAFISGLPSWGTLIGVLYKNEPIFGLMAQPFVGDIFYGDCKTAFLENVNTGYNQQLKTTDTHIIEKSRGFCTTPDMFISKEAIHQYHKFKNSCQTIRYGTDCYGYASLAAGWGEIVFEDSVKNYDIYPLVPIIQGAGGIITSTDGTPFKQGKVIACANKILHQNLLNLLNTNN
jgi:histidinol phosphatase-like enzyme (inositol monophosphatase family)